MAEVTELITKFSFVGNLKPLDEFNAGLGGAISNIAVFAAKAFAFSSAVNGMAIAALKGADSVNQLADETGLTTQDIQRLQGVAVRMGKDVNALVGPIGNLTSKIGEAAQKGSETFSRLGISVRDSNGQIKGAVQVVGELGARFRQMNLSFAEQKLFAEALGLDASVLKLIRSSSGELAKLNKETDKYGTLSKKQLADVRNFNFAFSDLTHGVAQIGKEMALQFAPGLTKVSKCLGNLLAGSKEFIIDGAVKLVKVFEALADSAERLTPFIIGLGAAFAVAKVRALGFARVWAAMTAPIVLWTAGIAAGLLILDDLIVAFRGGKSIIRDFFLEFLGFDIQPLLVGIVDGFKDGFARIGRMFKAIFTGNFTGLKDEIVKMFSDIGATIKGIFDPIFEYLKGLVLNLIPDWALKLIGADTGQPVATPQYAGNLQTNTSNSTISQAVNIDIRTDDPQAAGVAVKTELQRQLDTAQAQVRKGGR